MPRGVYQRDPGFGLGVRQRAARRREIQEQQAQEIEYLQTRLRYHRTATKRAASTIASQRVLLNGLAAFRELIAGLADADHLWDRPECDASAHVLLASLCVGPHADRIALITGVPRPAVVERELRLRRSGVWVGDQVRARWEEEERGDLCFALDVQVAEGRLFRSWDGETYSADEQPGPTIAETDRRTDPAVMSRRKGQHATLRWEDAQPCARCLSEPAYKGVCAEHILTVHMDDLRELWECTPRDVYARRWRILGLCKTCRQGPLYSSGFCEKHYRQHKEGNRRRKHRRRWTVSRDEMDQWQGAPPGENPAERDARAALFDRLLADLLRSVPPWAQVVGRPRQPIDVVLFATVTMARTNTSTRSVQPLLDAAVAAGHIAVPINHNTIIRYLGAHAAVLLKPARSVLATINAALAELGVEPGWPIAAAALAVTAEASPVWMRLLGVAETQRRGRPIDLGAREPVDDGGDIEVVLGRVARALEKVVAVVRERGSDGWLPVEASVLAPDAPVDGAARGPT